MILLNYAGTIVSSLTHHASFFYQLFYIWEYDYCDLRILLRLYYLLQNTVYNIIIKILEEIKLTD